MSTAVFSETSLRVTRQQFWNIGLNR